MLFKKHIKVFLMTSDVTIIQAQVQFINYYLLVNSRFKIEIILNKNIKETKFKTYP